MPLSKYDNIRNFFFYNKDTNQSECLCKVVDAPDTSKIDQGISDELLCGKTLEGSKVSNLKSHIKRKHPNAYQDYLSQPKKILGKRKSFHVSTDVKPNNISSCLNNKTAAVNFTKSDVIKGIVQMVTVDGRPFSIVNDTGFKMLMNPVMNALDLHINVHNLTDIVGECSSTIKNKIRDAVTNSLVSIKVDFVTKLSRFFFGINIHKIKNGEVMIYSLSAVEIISNSTTMDLKNLIIQELDKYGIDQKNIYTITTDNGANLENDVKLMKDDNVKTETDDAEGIGLLVEEYDWITDFNTMSVGCAANILQLSIVDTLKNSWNNSIIHSYICIIDDARRVVNELRTPYNLECIKNCGLPEPLIDNPTRWNSTLNMLERLLEIKSYCEGCSVHGNTELYLSTETWDTIKEITTCLLPSQKAMTKLQCENLTLTDAYKIWNICHFETAELGSPFSQDLLQNFIKRRDVIFENDVFIAAMFLDPRFNFEMSSEQKEKAIKHLVWMHNRINELNERKWDSESLSDTESPTDDHDIAEIRYERILREKQRSIQRNSCKVFPEFETICHTFIQSKAVLKLSSNIIKFWEDNKDTYPNLYPLAKVIFAVPGSQISVEKLLSQLCYIFNCVEDENSQSDNINNILLVRANSYLIE